jgi:hypothetical protein
MKPGEVAYNQDGFNRLQGWMKAIHGMRVKVGWVGSAAHQIEEDSSLTLAELAHIHEYGTEDGRIPERAPLRRAMMKHADGIKRLYERLTFNVLTGKLTAEAACNLLGVQVSAWIRETITAGLTPGNAASTIARKGSSKPLVDHGQLVNAVTYEIVDTAGGSISLPAAAEVAS